MRKLSGEHVETTVSGQPDSLITLGLYPKSYLKISFTTRELINVNISPVEAVWRELPLHGCQGLKHAEGAAT